MSANDTPIEELDLSIRTYTCLKRSYVNKVSQILAMRRKDLLSVRNFGRKSYDELRQQFINHGLMKADKPVGPFAEIDFGDDDEGVVVVL
jgi:DNA-directed RNA polymerase subunit alpha